MAMIIAIIDTIKLTTEIQKAIFDHFLMPCITLNSFVDNPLLTSEGMFTFSFLASPSPATLYRVLDYTEILSLCNMGVNGGVVLWVAGNLIYYCPYAPVFK